MKLLTDPAPVHEPMPVRIATNSHAIMSADAASHVASLKRPPLHMVGAPVFFKRRHSGKPRTGALTRRFRFGCRESASHSQRAGANAATAEIVQRPAGGGGNGGSVGEDLRRHPGRHPNGRCQWPDAARGKEFIAARRDVAKRSHDLLRPGESRLGPRARPLLSRVRHSACDHVPRAAAPADALTYCRGRA